MEITTNYSTVVDVIKDVYGASNVIRTSPMNLRDEFPVPAVALGWASATSIEGDFVSDTEIRHSLLFAYFGENETGLLAALDLLDDLLEQLPESTEFGSISRVRNLEGSKSLDYGFTMTITLKGA